MRSFLQKKRVYLIIMGVLLCVSCARAIKIKNFSDLVRFFPKTAEEIYIRVDQYMQEVQEVINKIIALKPEERSFETVALAFDRVSYFSNLKIFLDSLEALEMVSPNDQVRKAARDNILKIKNFKIDQLDHNRKLYDVFKAYKETSLEYLSEEREYFLEKIIRDYEKAGLHLPEKLFKKVKRIKKKIKKLEQEFITNISEDQTILKIKRKKLAGIDKGFIKNYFKKDRRGNCFLDCSTCHAFIGDCKMEETRKKFFITYNNQAFQNREVLQKIMEKRDELAQLLGFESYAHFDIEDQMAKTPQAVFDFLNLLQEKISKKAQEEFELLTHNLPKGITLMQNGKIKPWDEEYIKEWYIRKHFDIDLEKVSKYFPIDNVIRQMFEICEEFFGVKLKITQAKGLWHKNVDLVEVYSEDGTLMGYILLDLYKRKNKFTLPYVRQIAPVVTGYGPGANLIITSFEKSTGKKFMFLDDLEDLFHEFGHALHDLLGRTDFATFSGLNVKMDFVEMPSLLFEFWPFEKEMLKRISCHYRTKKPLADEIIDKIVALRKFYVGNVLQEDCVFARLALEYFGKNENKDPQEIYQAIKSAMRPHIDICEQDNKYASFHHFGISEYTSKYYSYLWAQVFALDILSEIRDNDFHSEIGKKYVQEILSKGGNVEPDILLKNFLGRKPNKDAFFEMYGILQLKPWEGRLRRRKRNRGVTDIGDRDPKRRKIKF